MSRTGSNEQEANGMTTTIVAVDGADGLTPDMLRKRKKGTLVFHKDEFPPAEVNKFRDEYKVVVSAISPPKQVFFLNEDHLVIQPGNFDWYFQDPMHD